jgi:hypothetical protein
MERLSLRDAAALGGGAATASAAPAVPGGCECGSSPAAMAAALGRPTQPIALLPPAAVQHVREAFGELLATSPSSLILSLGQGSVSRSVGGGGAVGGGSASAGGGGSLSQAVAADEARAAGQGGGARFNHVQYEAAMWDAFAQVYSAEVEARLAAAAAGGAAATAAAAAPASAGAPSQPLPMPLPLGARDAQLSVEDRRQILADILVWAEVTRPGYDAAAADFVTGPHASDTAFRRVGDALKAAKEERGLA